MFVMVVDDDPEDREIFCETIQSIDPAIKTIVASDGIEAVEYLNKRTSLPDFIFLDVNMPKMDGRECLASIKTNSDFNDITIIMYSTTESPTEILKYKSMGAQFLQKPSNISSLSRSLEEVLKSRINK
jgi:CheY-like chemotaxis protein